MARLVEIDPTGVSRRWLLTHATLGAATLAVASAGCGTGGGILPGGGGPSRAPALRQNVTVQVGFEDKGGGPGEQLQSVLNQWNGEHPGGPAAAFMPIIGEIETKLVTVLAGGDPPDIVSMSSNAAGLFASRQDFLPLNPLIKRDRYDLADFYDTAVREYEWKGQMNALPRYFNSLLLFYNVDMFERAGVKAPPTKVADPGWSHDDFRTAAQQAMRASGGAEANKWGYIMNPRTRGGYFQWLYSFGAEIFSPDFRTFFPQQDRAVEALQFMQDLFYKYRVTPEPAILKEQGIDFMINAQQQRFFQQGSAAMRISAATESTSTKKAASFRFEWAVAPHVRGSKRVSTGGGHGWFILKASKNHEETWAVLQHLVRPSSTALLGAGARKSTWEAWLNQAPEVPARSREAAIEVNKVFRPDPVHPAWAEIEKTVLGDELQALWWGQKSARELVTSVVPPANAILKKYSS